MVCGSRVYPMRTGIAPAAKLRANRGPTPLAATGGGRSATGQAGSAADKVGIEMDALDASRGTCSQHFGSPWPCGVRHRR